MTAQSMARQRQNGRAGRAAPGRRAKHVVKGVRQGGAVQCSAGQGRAVQGRGRAGTRTGRGRAGQGRGGAEARAGTGTGTGKGQDREGVGVETGARQGRVGA